MAVAAVVSDPDLQSILVAADGTHQQSNELLSLLDAHPLPQDGSLPEDVQTELAQQQKLLYSRMTSIRQQFRSVISTVRSTKQSTLDARADVDALHLRLQNLYYERAHVSGEITSCESYEHKYKSLPLIPLEDFLAVKPEFVDKAGNDVMVARIEHEHDERKALQEKIQGLMKRKQGLIAENNKRKEDLANLDKDLEKFIDAAEPIVKTFEGKYGGEIEMTI